MKDITISEELKQKAKELGTLITKTDEYKEVKSKQEVMFENEESMQLLAEFNKLQAQNHKKQQEGQLTPGDMKAIEQAELKMLDNPLIKEFHESQVKFQRLLNEVMKIVVESAR
ncbi:MAG: YlbF family regulator [Desulfotomaculum sp.]|nr:YlbF family regulator [Desulfotomaculum sp.]